MPVDINEEEVAFEILNKAFFLPTTSSSLLLLKKKKKAIWGKAEEFLKKKKGNNFYLFPLAALLHERILSNIYFLPYTRA